MIHPDAWRPVGGLKLEPNAQKAVTMVGRNVVVAAGPGAGKTELLAQRADFLLRTGICSYPRRILAVSFKVDAARNLRERVRARSGTRLGARFDSFTFHAFAKRLIDSFRPALAGQNALDADYRIDLTDRIEREQITLNDLVPLALEILESNKYAVGGVRQAYSHVFLDEFQDCTKAQYELIKVAFGQSMPAITAVGDTKQQIMAWAGALDGVLETFAEDFAGVPLPLYQNFRSAPRLRRMQNRMIADMDPGAITPWAELVGEEGVVDVLSFDTEFDEAENVSHLIEEWLNDGIDPSEIGILIRQEPHLVAAELGRKLTERGIAFRNEQESQDLGAEPVAALLLNFVRVIADERQPTAYTELMRVMKRSNGSEEEASRHDSRVKRMLLESRRIVRAPGFEPAEIGSWRPIVEEFLDLVSLPVLTALSPGYQQGTRLMDLIESTLSAFQRELSVDGDAIKALKRLSEVDAIRFLTIHKCKGLEFEKVVVLGVETKFFWGNAVAAMSEYFVAISRAKNHLVLTHAGHRVRPDGVPAWRWPEQRIAQSKMLGYATES
ncbi:ATP-dependent helicase [Mycolicibacterium obuense]|uniref:DNA 3'-5' helicase n=1 Tax=Mycolicibacterium obuense TaxID=1807 RepID=A0A0J6WAX6_9MYCO|nr:ATP-dependent helicase [Mycolicibacterium obuense]KMO80350.1 DNA helicase II [Mycolicibacterium obuense]